MVSDGAGFKQCLYLFSEIYSGLINNSDYTPGFTVNGDRGLKGILGNIGLRQKAGLFCLGTETITKNPTTNYSAANAQVPNRSLFRMKYHVICSI
jgi:NRPS condensation-like uncharacterized protein